jgi:hypothetical protein
MTKQLTTLLLIPLAFIFSCDNNQPVRQHLHAESPFTELSNETGIELFAINLLQKETGSEPEHLKTFFSNDNFPYNDPNQGLQKIPNGKTVFIPGVSFNVQDNQKAYQIVQKVRPKIEVKSYKVFVTDGLKKDDRSAIAVVRCHDEFTPLTYMQTNGGNYGIDTHKLILILDSLDKELDLKLEGADFDWCEFDIRKEPKDWADLAQRLYKICPDIVEQGTGTVKELENELRNSKKLYFWFD